MNTRMLFLHVKEHLTIDINRWQKRTKNKCLLKLNICIMLLCVIAKNKYKWLLQQKPVTFCKAN